MSILDSESNLLKLYLHAAGKSEIPTQWHIWSCLTMVAATVSNNVYYRKFPWQQLHPNLYTFLIGPSGVGKGGAIDFALQFYNPAIHLKSGITTAKNMVDLMSKETDEYPRPEQLLLVQTELADAVGTGPLADSFVKFMTECYTPSAAGLDEGTRTHGDNHMSPPCINWLAGTTTEWLGDCIDEAAMLSGFFGRVSGSLAEYDWDNRVYDPTEFEPNDYQEVIGYIYNRMARLLNVHGGFAMTQEARAFDRAWYETRRSPDAGLEAFWRREHDLTLKLAMIFSLCDSEDMTIRKKHIEEGQMMVNDVRLSMPKIVRLATSTKAMANLYRIQAYFQDEEPGEIISYRKIIKYAANWNIRSNELNSILYELQMLDVIDCAPRAKDKLDAFFYVGGDKTKRGIHAWELETQPAAMSSTG